MTYNVKLLSRRDAEAFAFGIKLALLFCDDKADDDFKVLTRRAFVRPRNDIFIHSIDNAHAVFTRRKRDLQRESLLIYHADVFTRNGDKIFKSRRGLLRRWAASKIECKLYVPDNRSGGVIAAKAAYIRNFARKAYISKALSITFKLDDA